MTTDFKTVQEAIKTCEQTPACKTSWIKIQNKPIKDMRKLDFELAGSRRVRDDNGLTMFSVEGNQQGGKSTYGMQILREIYEDDEDVVMSHIVMSIKDFTNMIDKALTEGYRERCIMWDDQSVEGCAATWVTDPLLVKYLGALGDTLGVATKGLILSSPSGDMTKAFRNYQKYIVQIRNGRHKYDRVAMGYWIGRSPMKQRWCSASFRDDYDVRIPFYERYAQKRRDISLAAVRNMKGRIEADENKAETAVPKPTIKEKVTELYRDWKAGVFGDDSTFKDICKHHKIKYSTARTYMC